MDPQSPPPPGETPGPGAEAPPPGFAEALRGLRESGLAGLGAAGDAAGAMRRLVAADMALARSAAGRAAAFAGAAVMFGASAWLLLMTALIVVLSLRLGLPWWLSLGGTGLLSGVAAWLMMRQAARCFEHTRFSATRRQLARMGIDDPGPDPEAAAGMAPGPAPAAAGTPGTPETGATP